MINVVSSDKSSLVSIPLDLVTCNKARAFQSCKTFSAVEDDKVAVGIASVLRCLHGRNI